MALNKKMDFEERDIFIADVAKALSHPARVKILKILHECNSCFCGQIVDMLPLSQATVSQHLKELKRAGLIKGEIEGPKTCYCINTELYEKSKNELTKFFSSTCNC